MAIVHSASTKRSLLKSLTFRIAVVIADLVVVYILTHRVDVTISVTIFTNLASTTLYFIHERIWNRIQWGRSP